jgi:hypothetical protein
MNDRLPRRHGPRPAPHCARTCAWAAALLASACTPTYDWRDVRPEGGDVTLMFPCSPDRYERAVNLAGERVSMRMLVCAAGGTTYALSALVLAPGVDIAGRLERLRDAAVANVQGDAPRLHSWSAPPELAAAGATRLETHGKLPDGSAVIEHAAFFARGSTAYQASVVGAKPDGESVETFLGSIKPTR